MSLKSKYKKITILELKPAYFDEPEQWTTKGTFKGLIQPSTGSKVYSNGKDTTSVDALLFCDVSVKFGETDILEFKGVRYKIAGAPVKPDGITGVEPKRGQHAEYNLVYTQEGL